MRNYRDDWFNVGAPSWRRPSPAPSRSRTGRRLSRPRLFSALNLAALMVHQ